MQLPRPVRRRNSIVLTSLVDVMFVLLFFFMLAASAVERRAITVGLPVAAGATSGTVGVARLDLIEAGHWTLDGAALGPAELTGRLRDSSPRQVQIRPYPGVPAQALVDALGTVRAAGIELRLLAGPAP